MATTWTDDTLKCNFVNENVLISIRISLKFVPKGPIDNKPLHEPMMTQFNDAYMRHPAELMMPPETLPNDKKGCQTGDDPNGWDQHFNG